MIDPSSHFLISVSSTSTEELQGLVVKWGSRTTSKLWALGDGPYILGMVRELRRRGVAPRLSIDELKGKLT